jgi:uncharacterized Tic20 family protein
MTIQNRFRYQTSDEENERASNSYLMSLIVIMVGLPIPIFNLLATIGFYVSNRKSTLFVKWHCTQALLSQLSLFFLNSYSFWWTMSVIFTTEKTSNSYFAYIIFVIILNLIEFVATIYTSIKVRKGIHVSWFFYGDLTNLICNKP